MPGSFVDWYSLLAPRETFPKAKSAAMRALEFDSTLAEAHASLAHIHFEFDHDWTAAEREYRRAIQLDPNYATAHHWYGGFLSAMGRHEEALQQAMTARTLDPLSPIIQTWVGLRYYFAEKYEEAIAEYRKALELDPDFAPAHWHLGWAYEQPVGSRRALSEAERAAAIDGGSLLYLASLGHAYARAGMEKKRAQRSLAWQRRPRAGMSPPITLPSFVSHWGIRAPGWTGSSGRMRSNLPGSGISASTRASIPCAPIRDSPALLRKARLRL